MVESLFGVQHSFGQDLGEGGVEFDQQTGVALFDHNHMFVSGVHGDALQYVVIWRVWEMVCNRAVVGHRW